MTPPADDPTLVAVSELAEGMVPMPDDFIPTMGPFTVLWYLWNTATEVITVWTAQLGVDPEFAGGSGGEVGEAYQHLMSAMGSLTEACCLVSLLPPEARGTDEH